MTAKQNEEILTTEDEILSKCEAGDVLKLSCTMKSGILRIKKIDITLCVENGDSRKPEIVDYSWKSTDNPVAALFADDDY